jgi:hypothetical protein
MLLVADRGYQRSSSPWSTSTASQPEHYADAHGLCYCPVGFAKPPSTAPGHVGIRLARELF